MSTHKRTRICDSGPAPHRARTLVSTSPRHLVTTSCTSSAARSMPLSRWRGLPFFLIQRTSFLARSDLPWTHAHCPRRSRKGALHPLCEFRICTLRPGPMQPPTDLPRATVSGTLSPVRGPPGAFCSLSPQCSAPRPVGAPARVVNTH